jgi:hypothetical protein
MNAVLVTGARTPGPAQSTCDAIDSHEPTCQAPEMPKRYDPTTVPKQTAVADHLTNAYRISVDGGQSDQRIGPAHRTSASDQRNRTSAMPDQRRTSAEPAHVRTSPDQRNAESHDVRDRSVS